MDVRLGGIYALERIARSSRDDHGPIMEVLTAFLREHSPRPQCESGGPALDEAAKVSADVQAVATVLGRRVLEHEAASALKLNLRGVDLRGVELRGASLLGADLAGANLGRSSAKRTCRRRISSERIFEERRTLLQRTWRGRS